MKKKLEIKKKVITRLTKKEAANLVGGGAILTSFFMCTGWGCCSSSGTSGSASCSVWSCK